MKHTNSLKDKQLVKTKRLNKLSRLEQRLPNEPTLDMDGSRFSSEYTLNSHFSRINKRLNRILNKSDPYWL